MKMRPPHFPKDLPEQLVIDRALREWRDELPESFAAETAALVESQSRIASERLEAWLQRALIVALIVTAAVAVALVGDRAFSGLASLFGKDWIYAVAVCFGLSLAIQHFVKGPPDFRQGAPDSAHLIRTSSAQTRNTDAR
jgi:hypothetical protein